jgi:hypothetical protein
VRFGLSRTTIGRRYSRFGLRQRGSCFPFRRQTAADDSRPDHRAVRGRRSRARGVPYVLHSGRSGTVHAEQVLEYNQDPTYLRDLLLYRLTIEAHKRIAASPRQSTRSFDASGRLPRSCIDSSTRRITANPSTNCWPCCRCSTVRWISWCGRRRPDPDGVRLELARWEVISLAAIARRARPQQADSFRAQ